MPDRTVCRIKLNLAGRSFNQFALFHYSDPQGSRNPVVEAAPGVEAVDVKFGGQKLLVARKPQCSQSPLVGQPVADSLQFRIGRKSLGQLFLGGRLKTKLQGQGNPGSVRAQR